MTNFNVCRVHVMTVVQVQESIVNPKSPILFFFDIRKCVELQSTKARLSAPKTNFPKQMSQLLEKMSGKKSSEIMFF